MTFLRPVNLAKAKNLVEKAHRDDWSMLLNFDDDSMPFRERIVKLEEKLASMPQVDVRIEHQFCDGLYARTMYAKSEEHTSELQSH